MVYFTWCYIITNRYKWTICWFFSWIPFSRKPFWDTQQNNYWLLRKGSSLCIVYILIPLHRVHFNPKTQKARALGSPWIPYNLFVHYTFQASWSYTEKQSQNGQQLPPFLEKLQANVCLSWSVMAYSTLNVPECLWVKVRLRLPGKGHSQPWPPCSASASRATHVQADAQETWRQGQWNLEICRQFHTTRRSKSVWGNQET